MRFTIGCYVVLISLISLVSTVPCFAEDAQPGEAVRDVEITNMYSGCSCQGEGMIIVISNWENVTCDFTNWTLQVDQQNSTYTFPPNFALPPKFKVRVHSKSGADTTTDLYWSCEEWDSGAVVTLIDDAGQVVSQYS